MGSRFITARLMAMKPPKYSIFSSAVTLLSEAAATLDISLTMPTGPDISLMPTLPPSSICRLRRTMRTVSSDWFHAIPSFSQKFGVLRVKFMP